MADAIAEQIRVRGLVQGVGFRPLVWRLAQAYALRGCVGNDAEGVWIHACGSAAQLDRFVRALYREPPPLARIDAIERAPLAQLDFSVREFRIVDSRAGAVRTQVAADAATCADCLRDVFAAGGRRRHYAFTNCTHCGPRLSIVRAVPYDRANTSMAAFAQCDTCLAEYRDPADRRFHAQPNCCPHCGPQLWLELPQADAVRAAPLRAVQQRLRAGAIALIKGIGGFHLACDATNAAAVAALRARKRRPAKPFALLARDLQMVRRYCRADAAESALLTQRAAPIVLMARGGAALAAGIAPGQNGYGFMLPATPLHHLLMAELDVPLVLTSGNRSGEPQCIDNVSARALLGPVADAALMHDRDIVNRLDDSVVRVVAGRAQLLRRARGYAPESLPLAPGFAAAPPLLALGGELKSTFCLLKDGGAIVSQHIGDLHNMAASGAFEQSLTLYRRLFDHAPQLLVVDRHPLYRASTIGAALAACEGLPLETVQHHHAHIAACLADNGLPPDTAPVLGIALDGLGYGADGTLWGGEFLLADYIDSERLASLAPVPMPGGEQAVRQPWRMAFAWLYRLFGGDVATLCAESGEFGAYLGGRPLGLLARMIDNDFNCPQTSSCGRLFDSVAAVLGLCRESSFEGQAAMALESCASGAAPAAVGGGYPFALETGTALPRLQPDAMWRALLDDLQRGAAVEVIAARFHQGLAGGIGRMVDHLGDVCGARWCGRVALSGGVFQNALLSELVLHQLRRRGLEVLQHRRVPANDGGLSLGQAAVAAARAIKNRSG
ncbi:carbamoyltransferase HypF [Microbulbifer sp. SAOS-129_SWC]|uniref:carbamoyltransferase HypF n=1 Tax=Microbulbifer sp. SAOS-129_SWC TaxID=3145235 RepID=UPI003217DD0C